MISLLVLTTETWFYNPLLALQVRRHLLCRRFRKGKYLRVLLVCFNELGLTTYEANKWFRCRYPGLQMTGMWRPNQKEIEEWLETKEHEFSWTENRNP